MFPTRSAGERPGRPDWLTAAVVLGGLLVLYYVLPVAAMLLARPPGRVLAAIGTQRVIRAAWHSVLTAWVATAIAAVLGVPLGYWLARSDARWRPAVTAAVVLPLVLPPTVGGIVLLSVVGPNTPLGAGAAALGIELTRSLVGVVLAQTFVASPFAVVTARAAFAGVDRRLERASRTLGEGRLSTTYRVTLPLAWPGIAAGLTLTFARAIGEFGATLMLAYYPRTLPVAIWVAFVERGLTQAYPVAIALLGVSVLVLAALNLVGADVWGG